MINPLKGATNYINQQVSKQADRLPPFTTPAFRAVDQFIKNTGGMDGWQQRGVLGAAAILTQPFIDLNNKNVDPETRKYSAVKTAVKICIGTGMGVLTRYLFGTALVKNPQFITQNTEKLTQLVNQGKIKQEVISKIKTIKPFIEIPEGKNIDEFQKGVSLFVGCIGTVISTIFVDKPLTNPIMNTALKLFNVADKPKTCEQPKAGAK